MKGSALSLEIMLNKDNFFELYRKIFELNQLSEFINDEIAEKMYLMTEHMLFVNEHMNLTAIVEPADVICKHLADSVIASKYIPKGSTVCDVGCGGGFPSLPLAIARPDLSILGIDSTEKRINYVNESANLLNLDNLRAVSGRAEDLSRTELRESFDICTARAVANLPILSEFCLPFVKVGGAFVAMKGKYNHEEITKAPETLGSEAVNDRNTYKYFLKNLSSDEERCIFVLKKNRSTDNKYPRNYSQMKKKPL